MEKKKAVVVVSGSYVLMQAFWIALAYPDYEWTVVLIKSSDSNDGLYVNKKLCENSGVFKNVILVESSDKYANIFEKMCIFMKMFLYYFIGKKKTYCRKYVEDRIGTFDYDLLCVGSAASFLEGAVLNFSDEIETIIVQEGLGDYVFVDMNYDFITNIAGKILYKMQYVNYLFYTSYPLNQNCIKFATAPEDLPDKRYKKIYKLFDNDIVNAETYSELLNKVYNVEIENNYDIVVFTSITFSDEKYSDSARLVEYLRKEYSGKKILVKKHPRDEYEYDFGELDVECKYTDIPGEVLIQQLDKAEFIFAFPSTLMMSVVYDDKYTYKLINYVTGMSKAYNDGFGDMVKYLKIKDEDIIEI